jgi:hypothetical protein
MVSPVPLIPQESRTLRSNQLVNEDNQLNDLKEKEPNKKAEFCPIKGRIQLFRFY